MLLPARHDLDARRPVWEALADLYLDTDVESSRAWRVSVLAPSKYTLDELQMILIDEVHPVVWPNLIVVAGVWSGFDPDWLQRCILQRQASWPMLRRVVNWGRWWVPTMQEWQETRALLTRIRQSPPIA